MNKIEELGDKILDDNEWFAGFDTSMVLNEYAEEAVNEQVGLTPEEKKELWTYLCTKVATSDIENCAPTFK